MPTRSIEDIIADWKAEHGIVKRGKYSYYRCISFDNKSELLLYLIQTMLDDGYQEDAITSSETRAFVVQYCCPPEDSGSKTLEKQKRITVNQWKDALKEFFRGKTADKLNFEIHQGTPVAEVPGRPDPERKSKKKKEIDWSKVEVKPSDMIEVNRDGYAETTYDLEFLADLGIDPPKDGS